MEDKIRGWGRFQGEKGLHCPSPTWGLSEESRGIVWMQEYPGSAKAKMVMNGPDLGDAVSSAEGFHTNEDASAERSEIICSNHRAGGAEAEAEPWMSDSRGTCS